MQKRFWVLFLLMFLVVGLTGQAWSAELVLNGESVDRNLPADSLLGKTFVSLPYITNKIGGQYNWNSKERVATVTCNGKSVNIQPGNAFLTVNGIHRWMDFPAYPWKDQMMVSVSTLKTIFDVKYSWDGQKERLSIDTLKNILPTPIQAKPIVLPKNKLANVAVTSLSEKNQILFSLQGQTSVSQVQRLFSPNRLVIDFANTQIGLITKTIMVNDEFIKQIRVAQFTPTITRAVIDLNQDVKYHLTPGMSSSFVLEVYKSGSVQPDNSLPTNQISTDKHSLLAGKKIVIDPGHGGKDPGAIGPTGIREKDVVLPVAQNLYQLLLNAGAQPIMTRSTDDFIDLVPRADIANNNGADLFISIHANAAGVANASGIETYSYINATSPESAKLAAVVQKSLVENMVLLDRGPRTANYSVLRNTTMPGVLAELGFITNPQEELLLANPVFQQKAAQGLLQGIIMYYQQQ